MLNDFDWSPYDKYSEYNVECKCGASYRSHTRITSVDGRLEIHCRKPCPRCGESIGSARVVRSDPEEHSIKRED